MTMRIGAILLAAGAVAAFGAGPAAAQDIEVQAQARGITLPAGYYERVARDPDFFELKRGWRDRMPAARGGVQGGISAAVLPGRGEMRMVVVMTLFSDSPEPPFSTEITHQQLFGQNPLGSLSDFYREISGGRVSLTGKVLPWVRTGVTRASAVGNSMGMGDDALIGAYLVDALQRVDGTVNFAQYDNNGPDGVPNSADDDGFVDVAVFQYSEGAASCGGPGPWPHRGAVSGWTGKAYTTDDLRRMLRFSAHGVLGFSINPLRAASALGITISALSFLYMAYVVAIWLTSREVVPGWASTAGLLAFLGGVQLLTLGILGEYVGRLFIALYASAFAGTCLVLIAPLLVTLALKVDTLVGRDQAPGALALVTGIGAVAAMLGWASAPYDPEWAERYEDAFVSEELTAWFRNEPQAVHVLCFGITPDDHALLQEMAEVAVRRLAELRVVRLQRVQKVR